jgi:hypothetical protein
MAYGYYPPGGPNLSKNSCVHLCFHQFPLSYKPPCQFIIINHDSWCRRKGLTGIIYVRSMTFESATKFMLGSRLVFKSLHFIDDKMGYLSL